MLVFIAPALLPLLLLAILASGLYLVNHSAQREGQLGRRHELSLIFEVGGHAVWCGPHPPTLRISRTGTVASSMAGESVSDGPLLMN